MDLFMTRIPGLAAGGDHFINHSGSVGSLSNAGRRTGGICTCDDGVVYILTAGDTGSGEHQNVGVDILNTAGSGFYIRDIRFMITLEWSRYYHEIGITHFL